MGLLSSAATVLNEIKVSIWVTGSRKGDACIRYYYYIVIILNCTFYRLKNPFKGVFFYSILLQLILTHFLLIFHGIGVSGIKCDLLLKIFKQM